MVNTEERSNNNSANVNETEKLKESKTSSPIKAEHNISESVATPVKPLSSSTNFAKNASTQSATAGTQTYHKLIPIQSVLHTADHQHYNQQHHHTHHNSSLNHSSVNLQLQQSGATSHLNAHNSSTLQQLLAFPLTQILQLLLMRICHLSCPKRMKNVWKAFKQLDRDGNGRIDIHDLSEALREFGLSSVYAE
ncbi:hypothetical protein EVAR_70539_1, partial [Eumeta japonica]